MQAGLLRTTRIHLLGCSNLTVECRNSPAESVTRINSSSLICLRISPEPSHLRFAPAYSHRSAGSTALEFVRQPCYLVPTSGHRKANTPENRRPTPHPFPAGDPSPQRRAPLPTSR